MWLTDRSALRQRLDAQRGAADGAVNGRRCPAGVHPIEQCWTVPVEDDPTWVGPFRDCCDLPILNRFPEDPNAPKVRA